MSQGCVGVRLVVGSENEEANKPERTRDCGFWWVSCSPIFKCTTLFLCSSALPPSLLLLLLTVVLVCMRACWLDIWLVVCDSLLFLSFCGERGRLMNCYSEFSMKLNYTRAF